MAYNFPSNPSLNDTYSYGGKTFVWNGVQWVQVGGTDGLTPKVLVSGYPPQNPSNGALWYSTNPDSPGLYVWVGSWQPANSSTPLDCGPTSTVSISPPQNPAVGDLWFNPESTELFVWVPSLSGGSWQSVYSTEECEYKPTVISSSSPPANPRPGDLWFNPESSILSVWYQDLDSGQWVVIVPYTQSLLPPSEEDGQILISASNSSFGVAWTNYINGGTF